VPEKSEEKKLCLVQMKTTPKCLLEELVKAKRSSAAKAFELMLQIFLDVEGDR